MGDIIVKILIKILTKFSIHCFASSIVKKYLVNFKYLTSTVSFKKVKYFLTNVVI
ncbi:hypothetical protein [Spiroplasma endosymbiont of Ammophila pubescens]|uniref:hypothetical protein n=1 Tax=Spiroplasma endosymbiont of Ammophila pubescens TaxID=3066315 RepID=UPI0032B11BFC